MTDVKFCKFCQCDHPLTKEWWIIRAGVFSACRTRRTEYYKRRYQRIKDSMIPKRAEYYRKNRDKIREKTKKYYEQNKYNSDFIEKNKNYRESRKTEQREYHKRYRELNKDRLSLVKRVYKAERKQEINKKKTEYERFKTKTDLNFKLKKRLRHRLYLAVKQNKRMFSAVRDLGCTMDQLKRHIESLFKPGMSWANWGTHGWHIDHVVPLSSFDLTNREQFLMACHYTNLQPLWAKENLAKSDKIITKGFI